MTLFDALLLAGNGIGAGAYLTRLSNPFYAVLGGINALAIGVILIARFA